MKSIRPNRNFRPCAVKNGDEIFRNGMFEFNISKLIQHITVNPDKYPVEDVKIDTINTFAASINEDYVDSCDITIPVILAEIYPGLFNLVDGNHRVEKARRIGMDSVRAYFLRVPIHVPFLISEEGYFAFVDYWNSKVKNLRRYNNSLLGNPDSAPLHRDSRA